VSYSSHSTAPRAPSPEGGARDRFVLPVSGLHGVGCVASVERALTSSEGER
jgi:hypothetical protein